MMILFRPFRLVLTLFFYGFVVLFLATTALTFRVWEAFPGDAVFPAECGLVFGAAVHRTDDPGPGITRRTSTAARLVHEGMVDRLIFTGGRGAASNESEAAVMRAVAMRRGVDPDRITLEEEATSTWENLVYARPLVSDCSSIVGISDRYHLARIQYLAELQDWGELPVYPADNPPNDAFTIRSVMREVAAMLYYMLIAVSS
ncbi:MAG: YdcF family protein [Patescibacteria group bacterium]